MSDQEESKSDKQFREARSVSDLPGHLTSDLPPSEDENAKPNSGQKGFRQRLKRDIQKPRFVVEIAALAVVVCYTAFAGYQSCKMRDATEASKESADAAIASVRAWIAPSGWETTGDPMDRKYPIVMKFKNVGHTLANDIVGYFEFRPLPSSVPAPKFKRCPSDIVEKMLPINANEEFSFNEIVPKFPVDKESLFKTGRGSLYIHGCIKYRDVLNPHVVHVTELCSYLFPSSLQVACEPNRMD